ncbi:MAG: hypothetical protein LBG99_03315 [Propionibacteriaceae bacterium]|jgi:hypothetical protein|nr:hypothetical protein [Propionibacteriaceae bacterium]
MYYLHKIWVLLCVGVLGVGLCCSQSAIPGLGDLGARDVNEMVAEHTGTNFIKDNLLGGNETIYNIIDGVVTVTSFISPTGMARGVVNAVGHIDDIADAARTASNAFDLARTTDRASDAATAVLLIRRLWC